MTGIELTVWIVSGVLAAIYLMAGMMKAFKPQKAIEMGPVMVAHKGRVRLIGVAEVLGAIGIIVPSALGIMPVVSGVAAFGLAAIQGVAIPEHIKYKDTKSLPLNVGLLLAALFVALARFEVF
jgi:uncharacterized membrane protein